MRRREEIGRVVTIKQQRGRVREEIGSRFKDMACCAPPSSCGMIKARRTQCAEDAALRTHGRTGRRIDAQRGDDGWTAIIRIASLVYSLLPDPVNLPLLFFSFSLSYFQEKQRELSKGKKITFSPHLLFFVSH